MAELVAGGFCMLSRCRCAAYCRRESMAAGEKSCVPFVSLWNGPGRETIPGLAPLPEGDTSRAVPAPFSLARRQCGGASHGLALGLRGFETIVVIATRDDIIRRQIIQLRVGRQRWAVICKPQRW
jgi:hypothetical protein